MSLCRRCGYDGAGLVRTIREALERLDRVLWEMELEDSGNA